MKRTLVSLFSSIVLSSSAYSNDTFRAADAAFANRSQGYQQATAARQEYGKMLKSLSGTDLLYAVEQMSRLDLFRGNMIEGVSLSNKRAAFDQCLENINKIKNTKSEVYYYYYTACLGSRGKIASTSGRLKYGVKMRNVQNEALAATTVNGALKGGHDAGGILRVMSAVRGNRKAKPLGLYNPTEAVRFAKLALATEAKQYRPYPDALSGKDYFENYFYLGQSQIALALENREKSAVLEGKTGLENTISVIEELEDFDELPRGREPETLYYKGMINQLINFVDECIDQSNWATCLENKLS